MMEDFKATQELILLRDAITSAAKGGIDFRNDDSAKVCAGLIKEAVDEVEMIMTVDHKTSDEKRDAESKMHSLIFYRTMMSLDYLTKEQVSLVEHICGSLPPMCIRTYLECIRTCDWKEFAKESSMTVSDPFLGALFRDILNAIDVLDDETVLDIWEFSFKNLLTSLWKNGEENRSDSSAIDIRDFFFTTLNNAIERVIVELRPYFVIRLCDSFLLGLTQTASGSGSATSTMNSGSAASTEKASIVTAVFGFLLGAIIKMLQSMPGDSWADVLVDKLSIIQKVVSDETSGWLFDPNEDSTAKLWNETVGSMLARKSENHLESTSVDLMIVNSRVGPYEGAVDRLVSGLQGNGNSAVLECLAANSDLLKPCHVHQLMCNVLKSKTSDTALALSKIIEMAFCNWSLEVQDSFRAAHLLEHGLQSFQSEDECYSSRLTTLINRLSSATEDDLMVVAELSYLCLRLPVETMTKLLDHAIENGRSPAISKLMSHLKSSCNFKTAHGGTFLVGYFKSKISNNQLSSSEAANLNSLVKALIEHRILDLQDFFANVILLMLAPGRNCRLVLCLLQTTLSSNAETVDSIFRTVRVPLVVWQLSKLLNYCLTVKLTEIDGNVLELKSEVTTTVKLITELTTKGPNLFNDLEICWLWKRHLQLHDVVICYWNRLFVSQGLKELYEEHVQQLLMRDLLLVKCLECTQHTVSIRDLQRDDKWSFRVKLTVALTSILPRMDANEVLNLIRYLSSIIDDGSETNAPKRTIPESFSTIADALILLSKGGDHPAYVQHLHHVVEISLTGIKTTVMKSSTSSRLITIDTLAVLICLACYLAANLAKSYADVIKVLILDLANEMNPNAEDLSTVSTVLAALRTVRDQTLYDQASRLLAIR